MSTHGLYPHIPIKQSQDILQVCLQMESNSKFIKLPYEATVFIYWIIFHFKEFQSAAVGQKIKIKMEACPKMSQLFVFCKKNVLISNVISDI